MSERMPAAWAAGVAERSNQGQSGSHTQPRDQNAMRIAFVSGSKPTAAVLSPVPEESALVGAGP